MQPLHCDAPHCRVPATIGADHDHCKPRIQNRRVFCRGADTVSDVDALDTFLELRNALEAGTLRAAEPTRLRRPDGG